MLTFFETLCAVLCGMVMALTVKLMDIESDLYKLRERLDEQAEKDEPTECIAPIRRVSIKEFNIEDID